MSARLIDGRRYAAELRIALTAEVRELAGQGVRPGLATVLADDSYPAHAYERRVRRQAGYLGIHYTRELLPGHAAEADEIGVAAARPLFDGLSLRPADQQADQQMVGEAVP
jgi:methylenetetrahydrofolate dehydrogenase (NADP+)/methenyltetrahydrofolate cyclohydrolase